MSKFSVEDKDSWKWTLMIMQPKYITPNLVKEAKDQLQKKKNPVALSKVKFEDFEEGTVAQIMHWPIYGRRAHC